MNILSNVEFEKLVDNQSPRLRVIAKQRCDADPTGFVTLDDIGAYAKASGYTGDHASSKWLKNLVVLHKNGTINRMRTGRATWEDHVAHVSALHAAKSVPFNIGQHVFIDDVGRFGSIVDYIPDSEEYVVVLDPFQVKMYKKKDIEKVAQEVSELPSVPQQTSQVPGSEIAMAQKMRADGYQFVAELPPEYGEPLYARSQEEAENVFKTQYPGLQPNIKSIDDYLAHL